MFNTNELVNGLVYSEFDTPDKLRAALKSCEPSPFGTYLWDYIAASFPCSDMNAVCSGLAENRNAADIAPRLSDKLRGRWLDYASRVPYRTGSGSVRYAADLMRGCVSSPVCRPCSCKQALIDFYTLLGGGSAGARAAAKKTVNNWLSGHSSPINREACIQLCYALGLNSGTPSLTGMSARSVDDLLCFRCGQNPLHLSSDSEAVHYYCLSLPLKDMSAEERAARYSRAQALIGKLSRLPKTETAAPEYTIKARYYIDEIRSDGELIDYLCSRSSSDSDYRTARLILKNFCEDYETGLKNSDDEQPLRQKDAREIINMLMALDSGGADYKKLGSFFDRHTLSEALYYSGIARHAADSNKPVERELLMLTILANDYGVTVDRMAHEPSESDSFADISSFSEFCSELSTALETCAMAPLYPRRRLDFLALKAYLSLTRDINAGEEIGALHEYISRSLREIASVS